jgi:hypothetical protein
MRTRVIAVMELVLIFPAALFMAALVLRNLQRSASSHVVRRPDVDLMGVSTRTANHRASQRHGDASIQEP